jgi:hypothetical protein
MGAASKLNKKRKSVTKSVTKQVKRSASSLNRERKRQLSDVASVHRSVGREVKRLGDDPWKIAAIAAAPFVLPALPGLIGAGASGIGGMLSGAGGFMSTALGGMGGLASTGMQALGGMFGGMPPATQAGRLGGPVGGGWGGAFGGIGDMFGGIGDKIGGMFGGGGGGEGGGFLDNLVGGVTDFFKGDGKGGEGGGFLSGVLGGAGDILGDIKGKLGDKLSDPGYMGDMMLRVGSNLAGAKLAGDGLSDDERKLFDFLSERMKGLRSQNQQLFDTHMQSALEVQNQARQYDPEYWGRKAQRDVQIADAAAGRQIEQKASMEQGGQGLSAADKRRAALDTTRQGQSAYLEGREKAQDAKMKGLVAGADLLPKSAPVSDIETGLKLGPMYQQAENRRRSAAQAMGQQIEGVFGRDKPKSTGGVTNKKVDVGLKDPTANA